MLSILILSVLTGLAFTDPHILYLKKFPSGVTYTFDAVETGARLYIASNDDDSYLKNIQISTNGNKKLKEIKFIVPLFRLDQLNNFNNNDTPKSLVITNGLTLRSTNIDTITNVLTGYLYVTTKIQADDPTFSVFVIKTKTTVFTTGAAKSTAVILNTELISDSPDLDKPLKTSYVSAINQSPEIDLRFHYDIPGFNWTYITINQFFENPLYIDNVNFDTGYVYNATRQYFDNVEPLQIGLDYWYLTTNGAVSMVLENKYVSNHVYTTTSVNATGLIVNNYIYQQHVVNFLLDYTYSRTVGTLITTFPNSVNYISFDLQPDDGNGIQQNFNINATVKHALMTTYFQASKLTINSTSLFPGTFYCQYYGYTGGLAPVTTTTVAPSTVTSTEASSTTTTTVATTTKSSSTQRVVQLIILVLSFVLLKH
ncbi:hypothetical protein CRE_31433 [Caenorhabditis remanei]|uniref:CUB-like domain-containing protein n=1 Tax=Caenorhabditis remanei TaxID=31234 RepID=E3N5W1_CAERE|nr:hypothetical protein CRE_31433 [Caenorhabditis remanei]